MAKLKAEAIRIKMDAELESQIKVICDPGILVGIEVVGYWCNNLLYSSIANITSEFTLFPNRALCDELLP